MWVCLIVDLKRLGLDFLLCIMLCYFIGLLDLLMY